MGLRDYRTWEIKGKYGKKKKEELVWEWYEGNWNYEAIAVIGDGKSMKEYGMGVNGRDSMKEGTVNGVEELTKLISSIFVFNASSTCLLRSLRIDKSCGRDWMWAI